MEFTENKTYKTNTIVPVEAIYTRPTLKYDENNRLLCALPPKLSPDEIKEFYYTGLPFEPSLDASFDVKEEEVEFLGKLCLPLKPVYQLENDVRKIIINSYRQREENLIIPDVKVTVADEEYTQALSMDMPEGGDGSTGAGYIGIGGCGKTTLVERLLSRYPKVVYHHIDGGQYVQIMWLKVQPISNGDLLTFLDSIAVAIDRALLNRNHTYELLLQSKKKLAEKTKVLSELFRNFNVGLLVIDEIQRFDIKKNNMSSFQTIMTMVNTTKVALFVVGTEQAYHKFFFEYYFTRRLGTPIVASNYCADYEYACKLIRIVMSANWFNPAQVFTDEVVKAMYKETSGIIERIIVIWKAVQHEYLRLSDEKRLNFVLTSDFIEKCAYAAAPFMGSYARQTLEHDMVLGDEFEKSIKMNREAKTAEVEAVPEPVSSRKNKNKTVADVLNEPQIFKTLSESNDIPRTQKIFERVKKNLEESGDNYKDGYILDSIVHTMNLKSFAEKTDNEIIAKSLKSIRKHTDQEINLRAMEIKEESKNIAHDFSKMSPENI